MSPRTADEARVGWWFVYALLALAAWQFWIAPLSSSLWTDEFYTVWAIRDGLGPMYTRLRGWPTISPAYGFIEWLVYKPGVREYILRLPSLIAISFATILIYRLARRLFDRASALAAVVVFVCAQPVAFAGSDARPYAVLLLVVTGSTLALVRWLETANARDAVVYVITAALIPHIHYLAGPVLGIHALYAYARYREGAPVRIRALILAGVAIVVLLLPLVPFYRSVLDSRQQLSWMPKPVFFDLAQTLLPPVLLFAIAAGLAMAWLAGRRGQAYGRSLRISPSGLRLSTIVLVAGLAVCPVLLAFAVARVTNASIFVPRYMIAAQVGIALAAGWAVGRIRPSLARAIVAGCILLFSLEAFGSITQRKPLHGGEDWRSAIADIRKIAGNTQMPVFAQTGTLEAVSLNLNFRGSLPSYVFSAFLVYPGAGRIILIPPPNIDRGRQFLESTVVPIAEASNRFLLLTRNDDFSSNIIQARLPGYTARPVDDFGRVGLVLFQRR